MTNNFKNRQLYTKSELTYVKNIYKKENDGNWTLTKEHIMPRKVQCGETPNASDTQIHSL